MPLLLVVLINHFRRRQQHLGRQIDRLACSTGCRSPTASFHHFRSIGCQYARLCKELDDSSRQFWRYFLSLFVAVYGQLICYVIYIIFFNTLPSYAWALLPLIGMAHLLCFVLCLRNAAQVNSNNQSFQAKVRRFYNRLAMSSMADGKRRLADRHRISLTLLLEMQTNRICALRFVDHQAITSSTVASIVFNISLLFILIFY